MQSHINSSVAQNKARQTNNISTLQNVFNSAINKKEIDKLSI